MNLPRLEHLEKRKVNIMKRRTYIKMTKTYVAKKMEYEMVKTINGLFYKCKKCGDLVSKEHRELHELSRHTY